MIAARGETTDGLDPETRRKRKMMRIAGIIGASLAAILAIVIVVVLVAAPRPEKPKETAPASITAKQAFEKYANIFLNGNEENGLTDEQLEITFASLESFYANSYANEMIDNTDADNYLQYIDDLNDAYKTFVSLYHGDLVDQELLFLPTLYYSYAKGKVFSEQNVRDYFSDSNDEEATRKYIRDSLNPDVGKYNVSRYLAFRLKYLLDYADVLVEARDKKCTIDGYGEGQVCSTESNVYKKYIEDKDLFQKEIVGLLDFPKERAAYVFTALYNELIKEFINEKNTSAEAKI